MDPDLRKIVDDATAGPWKARVHDEGTRRQWWDVEPIADMWVADEEAGNARFIATFDPVLVSALLDVAETAKRLDRFTGYPNMDPPLSAARDLAAALDRLQEVRRG